MDNLHGRVKNKTKYINDFKNHKITHTHVYMCVINT